MRVSRSISRTDGARGRWSHDGEPALRRSSTQDSSSRELLHSIPSRGADDMNRKRHLAVRLLRLVVKTGVILRPPQGLPTLLQAGWCILIVLGGNLARRQ